MSEKQIISIKEFKEFLNAKNYDEKLKIILVHSKKNNQYIKGRITMEQTSKTQSQIEQEITELNNQFSEFLHTKGIKAKFKLAFSNMAESANIQREKDKQNFSTIKQKSIEDNKEFVELLHTKGIKAKFKLIIDNIKKGAKESKQNTAQAISNSKNIGKPEYQDMTKAQLVNELNEFLKSKGLDSEYSIVIK